AWSSRSALGKKLRKFRPQALTQIGADIDRDGKRSLQLLVIGDTGIDQNAVVEVAGKEKRITLGGPGLLNHVDVAARIEPRAHRPQHLIEVAGIDVPVDHHRPPAGVSAALAR